MSEPGQQPKMGRKVAAGTAAGGILLASTLLTTLEGWRPIGYLDIVGVATRCYGDTGPDVVVGRAYDKSFCRGQLAKRVTGFSSQISACLTVDPPIPTYAAMLSFAYNVGSKAFCGSTVARRLNAGDLAGACAAMGAWVYAGGQWVAGLANRRAQEIALCRKGLAA